MKLLVCSDIHCDLRAARDIVRRSADVEVVIAAGDFARQHTGLSETIDVLAGISTPTVLVPGNNETDEALRAACEVWAAAHVLHGEGVEIGGVGFFGLGGGIPTTPWDWSFDLTEREAEEAFSACPVWDQPAGAKQGVLVVHSPPRGCADLAGGRHLGSEAVLGAIRRCGPQLVVCGHVHDSWGAECRIGPALVLNAGPRGRVVEF